MTAVECQCPGDRLGKQSTQLLLHLNKNTWLPKANVIGLIGVLKSRTMGLSIIR